MRIRRRLTLYGVAVTGITMLAFGVLLSLVASGAVPEEQDRTLAAIADELLVQSPVLNRADLGDNAALPFEIGSSVDPFTAVYNSDGSSLYSTGTVDGVAPNLPAAVIVEALDSGSSIITLELADDVEIRVHARRWPTLRGDSAVLAVGQSTDFLTEQLSGVSAVIWVAALLAIVASILVSYLVSGRALRPLRELAATTDDIGRTGNLSQRLPAVDAPDEVGALTASFNSMLDRLEETQERLSDLLDAQRRFVADASHELRSPLTTIRTNAGFLLDRQDATTEDRADAVGDISAEAERMTGLVDDLLTLATRDSGRTLNIVPVDVTQIMRDLRPRADALRQTVVWTPSGQMVVNGDRDALTRLLWILIHNAATHGATEVVVSAVGHPDDVSIVVSDDGPGFPDHDLDRVFERFYRADPARSPAGAGLGLSIAQAVASAHGGRISATNRPNGGAVVSVTIPRNLTVPSSPANGGLID